MYQKESMASGGDFNMGILEVNKPLECGCQHLLTTSNLVLNGWLRKRSLRNKLITLNWPQVYVVVSKQCLYYFSSETSKKPSGSISLYGFNKICRATGEKVKDVVWAFKLEHIQPSVRSLYFSASSEKEMVKWMKAIKQEMLTANGKGKRTSAVDSQYGESIASGDSWSSSEYNALEKSIYEEPVCRRLSNFTDRTESKDDSDFGEEEEEGFPCDQYDPVNFIEPSAPPAAEGSYSVEHAVSDSKENAEMSGFDYWSAVNYHGSKELASEILKKISQDGVYLVRKSDDGSNVLVVYSNAIKKFKLIEQESGKWTLCVGEEPNFNKMEDLLYYYYSHNLPKINQKLICPFQLHDDYVNCEGL